MSRLVWNEYEFVLEGHRFVAEPTSDVVSNEQVFKISVYDGFGKKRPVTEVLKTPVFDMLKMAGTWLTTIVEPPVTEHTFDDFIKDLLGL